VKGYQAEVAMGGLTTGQRMKGGTAMPGKILQINLKFSVSRAEYEQAASGLVNGIAAVGGLRWKVWIMNEAEQEAGGIYLFDDEASMKAYLEGPIVAQLTSHPALSDFSVKQFDVMDEVTLITRGPVEKAAGA
jgi:hypothetical protein